MTKDHIFPEVPLELIEALEELFPDRLPEVDQPVTMEEFNILRGRADLIRFLRHVHAEQNASEDD